MKIAAINAVPYGSTARIMVDIARIAEENGHVCMTFSGYSTHPAPFMPSRHRVIGGFFQKALHLLLAKLTGYAGKYSVVAPMRLLKRLAQEKIECVHLHNLHGWYLNLPMLFHWVKKNRIKVIWTLHDCWPFTGHCPHFDMIDCQKWQKGCFSCPQYRAYPESFFDNSKFMYRLKKNGLLVLMI